MGLIERLAKAIYQDHYKYLFNPTHEELTPGDVISFNDGVLHKVANAYDLLPAESHERARKVLERPPINKQISDYVQRGHNVEVSLVGGGEGNLPAAEGSVSAEVNFGLGGGCFFDVSQEVEVRLLAENDRLWLLRELGRQLRPGQLLVTEVVRSGYVAASTRQAQTRLGLTLDATVDPNAIGLGNLGDFMAEGKLNVTVKRGRVWRSAFSNASPLFRGMMVEDLPDILGPDTDAAPEHPDNVRLRDARLYTDRLSTNRGAFGVEVKARPMMREARVEDLVAVYGADEE